MPHIAAVIRFTNNMVMCFDDSGEQVAILQGLYHKVKGKVKLAASPDTLFQHGKWGHYLSDVKKSAW